MSTEIAKAVVVVLATVGGGVVLAAVVNIIAFGRMDETYTAQVKHALRRFRSKP